MGKKLPTTPRSKVRAALRALFLRSRERAAAIKRENNTCEVCGKKGSQAKGKEVKINVHHNNGSGIDAIIDEVFRRLLCDPKHFTVLCKDCHDDVHKTGEL